MCLQEARLRTFLRGRVPFAAAAAFIRTAMCLADPAVELPQTEAAAARDAVAGGSTTPGRSQGQQQAGGVSAPRPAGRVPTAMQQAQQARGAGQADQQARQAHSTGQQEEQLGRPSEQAQNLLQRSEQERAQQPGLQTEQQQPSENEQQAQPAPSSLQSGQAAVSPCALAQVKQEQPGGAQAAEQGLEDLLLDAADTPAAAAAGLTFELAAAFLVLPAEQVQAKASGAGGGQVCGGVRAFWRMPSLLRSSHSVPATGG